MNEIDHIDYNEGEKGSVIKEILRTPLFNEMIREYFYSIDSKNGLSFAKTLLTEGSEVGIYIIDALPSIINFILAAALQSASQMYNSYPPAFLKSIIVRIIDEVDKESLQKVISLNKALVKDIILESPELPATIIEALKGPGANAIGEGINSAVRNINDLQAEHPELIGDILTSVVATIDKKEFSKAATALMSAFFAMRPPLISWSLHMVRTRIKTRFRKMK